MPASPTMPEPNNITVPGSGVVPVVVLVSWGFPIIVNDSEGIVPTEFSDARDGPEFSSQYNGSPTSSKFDRLTQYVPAFRFTGPKLPVSVQMLKPNWLVLQSLMVKLTMPSKYVVPPNSDDVMETSPTSI